jgi:hypothetical protein
MSLKSALFFCLIGLDQIGLANNLPDTNAQKDTSNVHKTHDITNWYTEGSKAPLNQWNRQPRTVDTGLYNFQNYIPQYTLGNTGMPSVPIIFNSTLNPLGFYYGNNYLGYQLYTDSTIRYYNTRAPYTQFYYVTDPMIHQFFHFIHTQNFGKNFNAALEFQRTRSAGNYFNQATNINQLTLTINYHSKRYALFLDGIYGTYELDQNGGIVADSYLDSSIYSDRATMPVNLHAAKTTFTEESAHFKQYLFFGFHSKDSLYNQPLLYLSHSFRLAANTNIFSDAGPLNTNFYENALRDTAATYDSLHYYEIANDIAIGSAKAWPSFLRWEAGVGNQWVHYTDARTDTVFNNFIVHACIYDTGQTLYNIQAKEIFAGTQAGDIQAIASIGQKFNKKRSVMLQEQYSSQTPPLIYELYNGNTYEWHNNFNKTITSSASLVYTDVKWRLNLVLQAEQIQNLTYFTTDGTPQQYAQAIPVFSARLKKDFRLGKFHLNTNNIYQYVPNLVPLRFPQFVLENSFFYQNLLFHKALLLKVGVDVYYNSSYYGYGYNPVVDQYYVENQSKLGNYIYFNPYVDLRIKTFRMFFKLENAGSGLEPYNYFYVLHYPMPDRLLRMGISWDFWY